MEVRRTARAAAEAGWHESLYNLRATMPETGRVAIANLFRGTVAEYGPLEMFLMGALDEISESHPMVGRLARRGVICNFDERAAIEAMGRGACAAPEKVDLTIAPTLACNFDCPYCFEEHGRGKMSPNAQDDVVALVERLLKTSGARELTVAWFGGEPLLALDVISSLTDRLVELARRRGAAYDARIITNGYLLDEPTVALLERLHVTRAEITLDGVGAAHDSTRYLAGGGATFDRIVENLSRPCLPLEVKLRHNVHAGNLEAVGEVRRFVGGLARESGNDLRFHPMPLEDSQAGRDRGSQVEILGREACACIDLPRDIGLGLRAAGHLCCAQRLWEMAVDELGNLYKCQLEIGAPSRA
ncbi:MAG: radical SAM protein, partial [Atopobiaceae bacterium]|nr:radical SAM protein [Atopobiaceae bacterium]